MRPFQTRLLSLSALELISFGRFYSVNNLGGVYNTHLIESYCYLSPYALRPLLNAVKQWGKARCVASQYVAHSLIAA